MLGFWIAAAVVLLFGFVVFFGAPYVPSRRRYIKDAFEKLYPLGKDDVLLDIGSGDGIVLRVAAEKRAKAIGIELNPALVAISRWLSRNSKNVEVRLADFWRIRFPDDTTVVYTFIATPYIDKLVQKIQRETDRLNRPLHLIIYANILPGRESEGEVSAYRLYTFVPLQIQKP